MAPANGYRAVMYFTNWAIYKRDHHPQDLPAAQLTHVMYSFADINPETGEVFLADAFADVEKKYNSDPKNETGSNMYGCLKQLALLKKRNRHLKVMLSIGGQSNSSHFLPAITTSSGRTKFARSAVELVRDYGFDGLDIDWEFPKTPEQAAAMVELLKACRASLDAFGATRSPPFRFELSCASPGSYWYTKMDLRGMDRYLDFWNLMACESPVPLSPLQ
jgi:chitinase